jgi:serine phosphatase RsbU (regulator of sigma subunit)
LTKLFVEIALASVAQIRSRYQTRKRAASTPAIQAGGRPHHRALQEELASLKREHDDLRRAMYEAAQVQRRLCGPRHLRAAGYEFASEIFPVRHLSGDFISLLQIDGDLVFTIGDIAGKGLTAGMWFTHVIGMIRREMSALNDPAAALSSVNRDLLLADIEVPLTTLFLARVNLESGNLTYCNAGHPPALVIRENNDVQELRTGGPVLGAISRATFVNGNVSLWPGNTLIAYSDGIPECRDESGDEFGVNGLLHAARKLSGCKPSAMLFSVLAAVENFAGSQRREDDVALMVLHRFSGGKID